MISSQGTGGRAPELMGAAAFGDSSAATKAGPTSPTAASGIRITRDYGEDGAERRGSPSGSPLTVSLELKKRFSYHAARHVEGLRNLREEARVRPSPLSLDGRDEASVRSEPAAGSR